VLQNHVPDQWRLALGSCHHPLRAAEVSAVGLDDAAMRSASSRDANVNEVFLRVARSRNKTAYLTEPVTLNAFPDTGHDQEPASRAKSVFTLHLAVNSR
jgi:hypothetical protein